MNAHAHCTAHAHAHCTCTLHTAHCTLHMHTAHAHCTCTLHMHTAHAPQRPAAPHHSCWWVAPPLTTATAYPATAYLLTGGGEWAGGQEGGRAGFGNTRCATGPLPPLPACATDTRSARGACADVPALARSKPRQEQAHQLQHGGVFRPRQPPPHGCGGLARRQLWPGNAIHPARHAHLGPPCHLTCRRIHSSREEFVVDFCALSLVQCFVHFKPPPLCGGAKKLARSAAGGRTPARCRAHAYSLARDLQWGRALRNQL